MFECFEFVFKRSLSFGFLIEKVKIFWVCEEIY